MFIKVKNTFNTNKEITLTDGTKYKLAVGSEKIVGEYSEYLNHYIFKLLKAGFEVSKIEKEYIKDHMLISEGSENPSKDINKKSNKDNNDVNMKPKRKRGRPRKNESK